jgi:hypothetical protein
MLGRLWWERAAERRAKWKVLFVVDIPNWALERKTRQLQRFMHPDFLVSMRYEADLTSADLLQADLVLVYFWHQIAQRPHLAQAYHACRQKLLIGICAHNHLKGVWREPGLELMRRPARGVFVNNALLYREYAPLFDVPVFYTPNGVDTRFFRRRLSPRAPGPLRVGWAGSLINHGPTQRGYYGLIVPAVQTVGGAELLTADREERWRTPREMRIKRLRDDPDARHRMGAAARRSVIAWDWRHQAKQYVGMFRSILDATPTTSDALSIARGAAEAIL